MLINIPASYQVSGMPVFKPGNRAEPIHWKDTVAESIYIDQSLSLGVGVDADRSRINYDVIRVHNNRSRAGVIRAWVNIWVMPGVLA